ncbi:MAG6450 family protein [Companilactobacillus nodensis]|uniref:MAG6450 family protein n=1 Tax=Companilactobacillus nodensis TaxID=460870 RepID=UPI00350E419E
MSTLENISQLTYGANKDILFKLAITRSLDNGFQFKNLKQSGIKDFDRFVNETVGKELTISQANKLFLRTRGPSERILINGEMKKIFHYGKDRTPFRIFGYYDEKDYFCIHKIDPNHTVHRV